MISAVDRYMQHHTLIVAGLCFFVHTLLVLFILDSHRLIMPTPDHHIVVDSKIHSPSSTTGPKSLPVLLLLSLLLLLVLILALASAAAAASSASRKGHACSHTNATGESHWLAHAILICHYDDEKVLTRPLH